MTKTRGPGARDSQMRRQPALPIEELRRLLSTAFPEMSSLQRGLSILEIWHGGSRVREAFAPPSLRPGGTISEPAMMGVADAAMVYRRPRLDRLEAPRRDNDFHINFRKKPAARALDAECRLLKLGKWLAVGEIRVH
jgi:acyl-coenzyme A thioesterase PaaI-like protein